MNPQEADPNVYGYSYTWIAGDTWNNLWLWFHELGHSLWLQHANSPAQEYGDISSAMGASSDGLRCYNAPQARTPYNRVACRTGRRTRVAAPRQLAH